MEHFQLQDAGGDSCWYPYRFLRARMSEEWGAGSLLEGNSICPCVYADGSMSILLMYFFLDLLRPNSFSLHLLSSQFILRGCRPQFVLPSSIWCDFTIKWAIISFFNSYFTKKYRITFRFLGHPFFIFKWFYLFIYERHRERERERGRDTGRGRSRLPAGSLMWDSIPSLQNHALD